MTANQINAQYQREEARHNSEVESETQRHNEATEENDRRRDEWNHEYQQVMSNLQAQYNDAYIAYLNAAEEDKVALESEMNGIKQQMADTDTYYKGILADVEKDQLVVDRMYKDALAKVQWYEAGIAEKRAYYENQKTEAQTNQIYAEIANAQTELTLRKDKIEKDYELGKLTLEQRNNELKLAQKEYNLKVAKYKTIELPESKQSIKESKTRALKNDVQAGTEIVDSVAKTIDAIVPF